MSTLAASTSLSNESYSNNVSQLNPPGHLSSGSVFSTPSNFMLVFLNLKETEKFIEILNKITKHKSKEIIKYCELKKWTIRTCQMTVKFRFDLNSAMSLLNSGLWFKKVKLANHLCKKILSIECQIYRQLSQTLVKRALKLKKTHLKLGNFSKLKKISFLNEIIKMFIQFTSALSPCSIGGDQSYFVNASGEKIHFVFGPHHGIGYSGTEFVDRYLDEESRTGEQIDGRLRSYLEVEGENEELYQTQENAVRELVKSGEVSWIGLEILPDDATPSSIQTYRAQFQSMANRATLAGADGSLVNQVQSLMFSPVLDDYLRWEPWTAQLPIIGFDSFELKQRAAPHLVRADAISGQYFEDYSAEQISIVTDLLERLRSHEFNREGQIEGHLNRLPQEIKSQVREWARQLIIAFSYVRQRDSYSARNLLERQGPGVVVMGHYHRDNLLRELEKQCTSQASQLNIPEGEHEF